MAHEWVIHLNQFSHPKDRGSTFLRNIGEKTKHSAWHKTQKDDHHQNNNRVNLKAYDVILLFSTLRPLIIQETQSSTNSFSLSHDNDIIKWFIAVVRSWL